MIHIAGETSPPGALTECPGLMGDYEGRHRARSFLSLSICVRSATWWSHSKVINFTRKAMYILIIILVFTSDFEGQGGAKLALKDPNEFVI